MTRPLSIARWSGASLGLVLLALTALGASAASPKRVLILDPFGRDVAPFSTAVSSFRTSLARELGGPVDIYDVPLELERFAGPEGENSLVAFVEGRIKKQPVDLVVPVGTAGMQFAEKHRDRLFPNTPMLLLAAEPRMVSPNLLRTNTTLVTQKVNLPGMVEDILQLQPKTTNIVVVFGASEVERFWAAVCRREFQGFTNRVRFTWVNDLTLDQIVKHCASLPPNSFVLHALFVVDAAGVPCEKNGALVRLHDVANAPVFGYYESEFGRGSIGGRLYQDSGVGVQGARAAIRILRGEKPEQIPVLIMEATRPTYDWRELQRWGISETRLPADSIIRFRQPTLWERFRWAIIGTGLFCLLQAALIIGLLVNRATRRKTEAALRESELRLNLAADSADAGLWVLDLRTRVFWATEKARAVFGFPPDQVLTLDRVKASVHPDDWPLVQGSIDRSVNEGEPVNVEYRICHRDGRQRWIASRGRPFFKPAGEPERLLGLSMDITERKRAEMEAQELRGNMTHLTRVNTLGVLSGSLAHELNQPLGIILSNAQAAQELLQLSPPDVAEVQAILSDIVAADRRAGDVIERLRALLKRGQISLQPLSLNQVIEDVLQLMQADLIGRGVAVVRQLAPQLPLIAADRVQLQQVILNLILNGSEAMAANPPGTRRLHLQTTVQQGRVRVSVRDEGPGLPEDVERLFQPFYSTKSQGLGLGLAICRSIITAHDGRLWGEPHSERGAVFLFELPVAASTS